LLQEVRDTDGHEACVIWILQGVEETASMAIRIVKQIRIMMNDYKKEIRGNHTFYSRELLEALFMHPYTGTSYLSDKMHIHRNTAGSYLKPLTAGGLLQKIKLGRDNYYISTGLYHLLAPVGDE